MALVAMAVAGVLRATWTTSARSAPPWRRATDARVVQRDEAGGDLVARQARGSRTPDFHCAARKVGVDAFFSLRCA
jgi:hypothetical protein